VSPLRSLHREDGSLPYGGWRKAYPPYAGFFEYVHNIRKRGKSLLNSLVQLLIK